jgi:hypothetical protein
VTTSSSAPHIQHHPQPPHPKPPLLTAEQIENDCPVEIQTLGDRVATHLDKARAYEARAHEKAGVELRKADDHWNTVTHLIATAKMRCDGSGFDVFKAKYCPNLSRSRIYELLAIGSGKKTLEEVHAEKRESAARSRAKVSTTASPVVDSEPEAAGQVPDGGISAELSKPRIARPQSPTGNSGKRVAHVDIIELWLAASPTDRTKAIDAIGLEPLLAAIPPVWLPLLAERFTASPAAAPVVVDSALIPEDLSIPNCLRQTPPATPVVVEEEPPAVTVTADPIEDHPILRTAVSRNPQLTKVANAWKYLSSADELEEVIRDAQRYGVEHADEDHAHQKRRFKKLDLMRERLAKLRANEEWYAQSFGAAETAINGHVKPRLVS